MNAVVVDIGSGATKAGFASSTTPGFEFKSMIAKPKSQEPPGLPILVGSAAEAAPSITYTKRYPREHGIISNLPDCASLIEHSFKLLEVDAQDHPLMATEKPPGPRANRERMTQFAFETFSVPKYYVAVEETLPIFAQGITTGVCVSVGYDVTYIVPVYEGYALPHAIRRVDYGGVQLTTLVGVEAQSLATSIMEEDCFVSLDYENEHPDEKSYELPDGGVFTFSRDRMTVGEVLFDPSLLGYADSPGVHDATYSCIMACDVDLRKELWGNIILAGGTTALTGFSGRLQRELSSLAPANVLVRVVTPSECHPSQLAFRGGAILANLSSFEQKWITKAEYEESGPSIVHRKCY